MDDDRRVFLAILAEASERFELLVDGYCLMTNHVHLVVTPRHETSLAEALKRTNQLYAQYVNRFHGRSGHLWQDRFFSCPLDEVHYRRALVYIERNPVRARLRRKAWRWPWSSAAAHCEGKDPTGLLDLPQWNKQMDRFPALLITSRAADTSPRPDMPVESRMGRPFPTRYLRNR